LSIVETSRRHLLTTEGSSQQVQCMRRSWKKREDGMRISRGKRENFIASQVLKGQFMGSVLI
jgi:hypothetical protein